MADARALIEALDGARLEKQGAAAWGGFFEGEVAVAAVEEQDGVLRFEIVLPTSRMDIADFIWSGEEEAGFTDKVVLTQGGADVPDSRVVRIVREGEAERWAKADSEQYRLTFEVGTAALRPGEPLEVRVRWQGEDVAVARGT